MGLAKKVQATVLEQVLLELAAYELANLLCRQLRKAKSSKTWETWQPHPRQPCRLTVLPALR